MFGDVSGAGVASVGRDADNQLEWVVHQGPEARAGKGGRERARRGRTRRGHKEGRDKGGANNPRVGRSCTGVRTGKTSLWRHAIDKHFGGSGSTRRFEAGSRVRATGQGLGGFRAAGVRTG